MEKISIEAILRTKVGKEISKKERKKGLIPAIIYGRNIRLPISLTQVSLKLLKKVNFSKGIVFEIHLNSKEKETETIYALIKDVQYHPLTEDVIHIDFLNISLTEKIKASIPIVLKGEAKGTKDGGIVQQILWGIEVEGFPTDIPQKIEVDISDLMIGHAIHVLDIKIPENIKIITSPEATIVTVVEKVEEVVTTSAEDVPEGPEVIKEKKETEEAIEEDQQSKQEEKTQDKGKSTSK
ncbi:MAG: 50S ribosomal protein L25 [Candidatus Omnitrophica bacterium]|nr:50S ribosomal protein L25 [Candidatus Omnitrophota bacterium]